MDLLIREVQSGDEHGIVAILNRIIAAGTYSALDTPQTVQSEREFIAGFPERGVFCVAENRQDGRIVGLQTLEPFATYTRAFDHVGVIGTWVDLSLGRHGIGTCLCRAGFERAKSKGYEKLFALVRADNQPALDFYRTVGFRVVGTARKHAKFGETYVDEVIIEKFLDGVGRNREGSLR